MSAFDFLQSGTRRAFRPTRRNVLHWISWAVALSCELALAFHLRHGDVHDWEVWLTRKFQDFPHYDLVFHVTSTLTNTLSLPFALLFAAILTVVWLTGRRLETALLALSFPLHVLSQFPKALIDRPRPPAGFEGLEGVGGYQSFPSGHSEYVITFYGFLTFVLLGCFRSTAQRVVIVAVWIAFALGTGFGRVAAGRHWPLDVLVSYVVGAGLLSGLIWLYLAFKKPGQVAPQSRGNGV